MTLTETPPPRRGFSMQRSLLRRIAPGVLVLAGVLVLLYPVVATQYNNARQQAFAATYNRDVEQAAPNELAGDLARAHAYNQTLNGVPILDPWLQHADSDPGSEAYQQYTAELNRFDAMARLRVPSAEIDLPVYHGTTDPVLAKGVGHLYGTSLPVGGVGTHAVLTSHTGLASATLFDHLTSVEIGDMIYVDVLGETIAYRVDQIKVVLPTEVSDLTAVPGHDYLTLFTCTPYAINTHRLLVRGERVPFVADAINTGTSNPRLAMEPWMWLLVGGAAVGVAAILAIALLERRRRTPRRGLNSESDAPAQKP